MEEKLSNVARGDKFRDSVAALLRTKYPDAQTEVQVAFKKVDVVYSHDYFGQSHRVGVECKHFAEGITKDKLLPFVQEYRELVESGHLDTVFFIVSKAPAAASTTLASQYRWLRLMTREALDFHLLGIQRYLSDLKLRFSNEGLQSYYVEGRIIGQTGSALDVVERWLYDDTTRTPIAVMGGYGKGKSSFSLRLASRLAQKNLEDPSQRIPILLRLGQVVHEADLEGLFGKLFTASQRSVDFSFETLMHLNTQGRLCVILDGFDEMKHAMSAADFKANFKQFNRLLTPNSKVIILGRPNALQAETHELVFRGQRESGGAKIYDVNFSAWDEYELAFFDEQEVHAFLTRYMVHLGERSSSALPAGFVENRVAEIVHEVELNVLQRPVHAKIVAELASSPTFNLRGFTKHALYEEFIKSLIERDVDEKRARGPIGTSDRRAFQEKLAWWCWTRPADGQGYFDRDDVPSELIADLSVGDSANQDTLLDEYLVSSLTEAKDNGILYFAHRSFEEFLVSEFMRKAPPVASSHLTYANALNEEIIDFLEASGDETWRMRWFSSLSDAGVALPIGYYACLAKDRNITNAVFETSIEDLAHVEVAMVLFNLSSGSLGDRKSEALVRWFQSIATEGNDGAALVALLGLAKLAVTHRVAATLALIQAFMVRVAQRMKPWHQGEKAILVPHEHFGSVERLCSRVLSRTKNEKNYFGVELNLDQFRELAAQELIANHKLILSPNSVQDHIDLFGTESLSEHGSDSVGEESSGNKAGNRSAFFLDRQVMGAPLSNKISALLDSLFSAGRHATFRVVPVREVAGKGDSSPGSPMAR